MPTKIRKPRRFEVRSRHRETVIARVVEEVSVEAAAISFVEDVGGSLHQADEHVITIYVRDLARGGEQCLHIDLDTGQSQPCT